MTLYFPKATLADPDAAYAIGVRFVEYFTSPQIGLAYQRINPATRDELPPIDYSFDTSKLAQRLSKLNADTDLIVLDILDGGTELNRELKKNKRGEAYLAATLVHRVVTEITRRRVIPVAIEGMPDQTWTFDAFSAAAWHVSNLNAITSDWGKSETLDTYVVQKIEGPSVTYRAAMGFSAPLMLARYDDASGAMPSAPDSDIEAVFKAARAQGVTAISFWRNLNAPLVSTETVTKLCAMWAGN